jgi:hypothetical protein
VRKPLALVITLVALAGASACGPDQRSDGRAVTVAVEEQVAYLEPESSLALALDLRYEGENWERLRPLVSRVLSELRGVVRPEERLEVPPNADAALAQLATFAGLDFEDDLRPLLDGHLVAGITVEPQAELGSELPDTRTTLVYRTGGDDLRRVVEKVFEGAELRPLPGHEDVLVVEDGVALVGDDTIVAAERGELLRAAVERAESGAGFPAERLRAAERGTGLDDPLLLATGDLDLARNFVTEDNLARARAEVPYLAAIERIDMALDVAEQGIEARAQVVTTRSQLSGTSCRSGPRARSNCRAPTARSRAARATRAGPRHSPRR